VDAPNIADSVAAIAGDGAPAPAAASRPTHSLVRALAAVPSLAPFGEQVLLQLAGDTANLLWRAGSVVFERGSPSDGLYLVLGGAVRVLGDRDVELAVLGPGEYFGEFSLLLGTDHQHEVRAAEDSELLVVPREIVEGLLEEHPELAERMRRRAEERQAANVAAAD
jgi:CRP-like cAMP-binding protein